MPACWKDVCKESERGFVRSARREREGIEVSEGNAQVLCLW